MSFFNSLMTATPDSFSMADFEAMLENAPQDITDIQPEASEDSDERAERLTRLAAQALDKLIDEMDGVDAAQTEKAILHMIAEKMLDWHSRVGIRLANDGDHRSAMGWLRDAGKFQAVLNILDTVGVGPEDFTCGVSS